MISCRKYEEQRQVTMTQPQRSEQVGARTGDVLECGDTVEGRKLVIRFLRTTGLITRLVE